MPELDAQHLYDLARKHTREARNTLFENLTDLFLSDAGRLNEHERALMSDILAKLVREVEKSLRAELAERLAGSEHKFPDVAALLANDSIEIARPILEKSDLLKDEQLIEIIRKRTEEHRMAIAIRENVSASVSDELIDHASENVVEALIRNPDAEISKRAMEYLVAESRRYDQFQEPLVNREDLPAELAYRMFWWVSAALRRKIISEHRVDEVELDKLLTQATGAILVDHDAGANGAYVRAQKMVHRMAEAGELTHTFLLQSLRQQRLPVFVAGLGELGDIGFEMAWQIFADRSGETLAILAKAINITRSEFTSMYLLIAEARDGASARATSVLRSILDLFDAVDSNTAQAALLYWRQDVAYQISVDELSVGTA